MNAGIQGRFSDGGVLEASKLGESLDSDTLNFPVPAPLPGRTKPVPYVFIADAAFPLHVHIMKPYMTDASLSQEERVYNYRLSRARRVVESAFGILAAVFRVLRSPILLDPEKTELVVMACVVLHNYLRRNTKARARFSDVNNLPHLSLLPLDSTQDQNVNHHELSAIRAEFKDYFNSSGVVNWQYSQI